MRFEKSFLFNIILAVLCASIIFLLSQTNFLKRAETSGRDLLFHLRGGVPFNPNIVIIEITDTDISEIGHWPWKRSYHAAITAALNKFGAKSIYFDILFSEPALEEDDAPFEEAIKLSKNVFLPFVFQNNIYDINTALYPIKRFSSVIKGTGSANTYPDRDGTVRQIPLIFSLKKETYPHISLKIASDYANFKIEKIEPSCMILSNDKQQLKIPFVKNNNVLLNWSGQWKTTFKHYDFLDVLTAYDDITQNKKPELNIDDFKNSICLIAVTAVGLYDIRSTPLQPEYPGIGIIATAISNILNNDFFTAAPCWINILILYLLSILPVFLFFGKNPLRETLFLFLSCGIYFAVNFLIFKNGTILQLVIPLLGMFTSSLTIGIYNFAHISFERQKFLTTSVTDGLTQLYNISFFKQLLDTDIKLGKREPGKKFCILMGDIDYFKNFNDTYGHQTGDLILKEIANILKISVRSTDIVARYGGEEMIILLRGAALKDGRIIGEKIRKNIETHLIKDKYKVTISAGISVFKPEDDVETIIKRADDGLYQAKQSGRNRVCDIEEAV